MLLLKNNMLTVKQYATIHFEHTLDSYFTV